MGNLLKSRTSQYEVLYLAKIHWISYLVPCTKIFFGILGFLLLFSSAIIMKVIASVLVIVLIKGIFQIVSILNTKIFVSSDYLTVTSGVVEKRIQDIALSKMEGMSLYQNLLGKIFNYGSLLVSTGEITHRYMISKPVELRSAILRNNQ